MTGTHNREQGASMVEMALVAPFLILLLLGIVEFGWLLGQFNDVRHGAREGARFAAVAGGTTPEIVNHVCTSMEGLTAGMTGIQVELGGSPSEIGDVGEISVTADVTGLSNAPIISGFLPSTLSSTVSFRMEQPPSWSNGAGTC